MAYDVGDKIRLSAAFVDIGNNPADPTTVTVKYKAPTTATVTKVYITDAEVIKDATGNYHIDVSINEAGGWKFRWEGTGAVEAAAQATFDATAAIL